jgi:uncharacterized protein involved in exopolysaccharide biosynthesis
LSEHTSSFDSTNQPGANSPGEAAAENGYNNALNSVRRVGDYGGNASQLGLVSEPPVRPAAPIHIAARSYNDDIAEGFNLQNFFEMLRRRRGVLFGTFGIVFVLGLLYTLLQRPIYKATAQILVATASGPGSSGAGASALRELIPDAQPRSLGTQVAILQSPPLQKAAVKRLKPAEQKEVRKFPSIEIRPVRDAEVISVAVAAYVPTTASNMANALCDQYILENEKQNEDQIQSTTLYVKNQLPPARARLDKAARALRDYQQKNETVSIDQETQARVTQLAQLDASRREAEAQSRASATEMAQLKQQIASLPVREESQTTTGVDPTAAALQTKLTTLENERRDALVEYTPTSRTVRDIERRIAGIRAQLSRIPKVSTNSRTQTLNPLRQSLLQSLANTQVAILSAQSRAKSLGESVQQERKGLRVLPERSYRLANLALDRAILEQSYRTLNDRYQNLLINASASGASVRVISPAEVPRRAISPNRKMNILLSVVLGILLALALAALVDRLDDRVHSTEDVEHVTGLPVLAHVPFIKNEAQQCLVGNTSKPSPLLESYRMLRSNLAFAGLDEPVRSVVLTSSQPGEGKSVSSVNLATVMALSGKSVIVVDCDLRRPKVHKLFGFATSRITAAIETKMSLKPVSRRKCSSSTAGVARPAATWVLSASAACWDNAPAATAASKSLSLYIGISPLEGAAGNIGVLIMQHTHCR